MSWASLAHLSGGPLAALFSGRSRKKHPSVKLISDVLSFGRLP